MRSRKVKVERCGDPPFPVGKRRGKELVNTTAHHGKHPSAGTSWQALDDHFESHPQISRLGTRFQLTTCLQRDSLLQRHETGRFGYICTSSLHVYDSMRFRQCMHALNYHTNSCSTTCRATWILRISASHYLDTDRSSALYFHPGESARWGERLLLLTPCESHGVLPCIDRSCFESNDLVRPPVLLSCSTACSSI
jgi:hypothetical protein